MVSPTILFIKLYLFPMWLDGLHFNAKRKDLCLVVV